MQPNAAIRIRNMFIANLLNENQSRPTVCSSSIYSVLWS